MVIGGGVVGHERRLHRDRHGGRRVRLRPHRSTACASSTWPSPGAPRRSTPRRWRSRRCCPQADLVIGAVLVHGAARPVRGPARAARADEAHAVLVDVSIDQGGCFETSRPTTHSDPTYEVDGITHYCVTNMPGAVPITSTYALTNATLPYVLALADLGVRGRDRARSGPAPGGQRGRRPGHPSGRRRGVGMPLVPVDGRARPAREDSHGTRRAARWQRHERPSCRTSSAASSSTPPSGETEDVLNPATGEVIAEAPLSGEATSTAAVGGRAKAFEGWAQTTPGERSRALLRIADAIEEHGEEIADLEAADAGKPRRRSSSDELPVDGRQPALLRRRGALPGGQGGGRVHGGLHLDASAASRSAWSARSRRGTTR